MTNFTAVPENGAVWITGGSTGIGKEVAYRLADEGFTVYISARSLEKLEATASGYNGKGDVIALPLDVSDRVACAKTVDDIVAKESGIAVAIFNAGMFIPTSGKNLDFTSFDRTMDVNYSGVINGMLPVIEVMKEAECGQLAIVSSVAGYGGLPKNSTYGSSKAALINLAESLKFDLDRLNIKMQLINPGFVDTPMTEKNDFPMPFLMPLDKAADRVVAGLKTPKFELTFPRRFTWMLKLVNLLPYWLYFKVVAHMTGAK